MRAISESPLAKIENSFNLLALAKEKGAVREFFIFKYTDEKKAEVIRCLSGYAQNDELDSFTWFDAAVLSMKVRQLDENGRNAKKIEEMRATLLHKLLRNAEASAD